MDSHYTSEYEALHTSVRELKDEIRQLEEYVDDLKVCANCYYIYNLLSPSCCDSANDYCDKWKFDGVKQKDRKI